MDKRVNLLDLDHEELIRFFESLGEKPFRSNQLLGWIQRGVRDIGKMTDMPVILREALMKKASIGNLSLKEKRVSKIDGTIKYLFQLPDKEVIESVLMNYNHGYSVCISSQIGCRMGCLFCASTGIGFGRNLSKGEMLEQVIMIRDDIGRRIKNIVVMGIGEPLENYESLVGFLKAVNSPKIMNIGYRHITVSTCGLAPQIEKLSKEGMQINLSVSLHAPNDYIRTQIMPINKKYAIDNLIEACKIYTRATGRRVTFEYILISGLNDSKNDAVELSGRLKNLLCHVNLIPFNTVRGLKYRKSSLGKAAIFKAMLEKNKINATIRRELGSDIDAACGQLRRHVIKE